MSTAAAGLKDCLFNRDLSLIEFFRRVLGEALDENEPLLERLKFLAILSSNLDEFFMIRVSGLKEKLGDKLSPDGSTAAGTLARIRPRILELTEQQTNCLLDEILPRLSAEGIRIASLDTLSEAEKQRLNGYFNDEVYPIVTPQAVDPAHPFPYISGGSLNLGLIARPDLHRRTFKALNRTNDFFVRIKIPPVVPRFVPVDEKGAKYVLIEDLIAANVGRLVPGASPESCFAFRITRDADIEVREEEAGDLLAMMEENLKQKRFGDVVRLEVSNRMPSEMVDYLTASLEIGADDVYPVSGPLNLADFMFLHKIGSPELKDKPLVVTRPAQFQNNDSIFDVVRRGDVLLHHPYHPYSIVTDLIREAAEDPDVLAIKMCLYRTGHDSPIPPILIEASERGKQVTVLIELKARFDEKNNIEWAKKLERAGIHVVYGLVGLKTHCKTTLIVRREDGHLRRYVHLATGNYNPETSAVYTDLGLLTVDQDTGADATELFNYLTAYSQNTGFRKLLVAPLNLRERMLELIRRETAHAHQGKPARIVAKFNRLADTEIIEALYEASRAGVRIDLIVRGICMLRPGIEGLSENIRVRSVVGRLLEHSRVYYFENAGDGEVYIGSSDWMPRNLDRRVEVVTPVENAALKKYLKDEYLAAYLRDNVKAQELQPDGSYRRAARAADETVFNSQLSFQNGSNILKFAVSY
ncbi:MAG: polyphosphate kinase 1 [Acidobacteria bacterium]|nr:polyphosphate kinase 1 [Acidobacteriota bacterium]